MLQRVCIFCGSSTGMRREYREAAEAIAIQLARRRVDVVFGGGCVGLMGIVADTALAHGGHVIGVIPSAMVAREIAHRGLPDLRIVSSMHERKALMASLSDAFIALPGGFGTFEEFFEVVTWTQLGLHRKPCGLLNVAGYYDPLVALFDRAVSDGFIRAENRGIVVTESDPEALIHRLNERPATAGSATIRPEEA
ncbi:MAG TPA: TIGR00730 family Rossman fold protein [Vicinamibacterales bacterium]|nr:TIGR00730 family Rossman fold protein [Vicinamibacterales bacterium]